MFISVKTRELLITTGVALSCGLFVASAIACFNRGAWGFVFAVLFLSPVPLILTGNRFGYIVARYLLRAVAWGALVGRVINPFAWTDVARGFASLIYFISLNALVSFSAFCLSYCLSEHAKRKGLRGAEKWRSFP